MTTAARLEAFLEMMSAERGASDNTLAAYRRDLEDAAAFLGGRLVEAGSDDIRAFLDDVARRGFAPTSQARKLSSLRQFFRFLYAEGLRTDDPTGTVDAPRKERALPRTMREDAVARLIARAPDLVTEIQRLRTALEALFPAEEGFTEAFDDLVSFGLLVEVPADDAYREEWDAETMYVWAWSELAGGGA